jgi:hypothetical protein
VHHRRIVDRPQLLRVAEFVQHGASMNNFVLKIKVIMGCIANFVNGCIDLRQQSV